MTAGQIILGAWFIEKWRARLDDSDAYTVARQLRKQGVPLAIARYVLLGMATREAGRPIRAVE